MQHFSLVLYNYLSRHIVGYEETVKSKRLFNTVHDNLSYDKYLAQITSGSFGEGLEMKGSDLDYMFVMKDVTVFENESDVKWDKRQTYFAINTEDTKLGFVKLVLRQNKHRDIAHLCLEIDGRLVLSNILFKHYFGNNPDLYHPFTAVFHGPCLSDREGLYDLAFCLQSMSWISQAGQWRTRPHRTWPTNKVVSQIVEHGVLFVPVGVKGSSNEEIEWRLSFSVGEKFLIYSFNHTQLLCYALLKIVLKDIINADKRCKDLLCSYYLKNILFWVSEETHISEWKPQKLIPCFQMCFKRLIYCVQYSLCPHYFIPENNMFETKIDSKNKQVLLDKLQTLLRFSWHFILCSPQIEDCFSASSVSALGFRSFSDHFEQIICSEMSRIAITTPNFKKAVRCLISNESVPLKLYYLIYLLVSCKQQSKNVDFQQKDSNQRMYRKFKSQQSYMLLGIGCDAVSGWLRFASFYYQMKQYRNVLSILRYSESKCSNEKITINSFKLSKIQHDLLNTNVFKTKGLIRSLLLLRLDGLCFDMNSKLIPFELQEETIGFPQYIPPVVFLHFLSFLCHYHLNNIRMYRFSLTNLKNTISQENYIVGSAHKSVSYNVLGVALQIIGENESARKAFQYALELDPEDFYSCARQRLSMID